MSSSAVDHEATPPRPASLSRVQSTASATVNTLYPLESAASSLSSLTSYFGASLFGAEEGIDVAKRAAIQNPVPIINKAFAPYVPVIASADANAIAEQKGFSSFFELLRPFGEHIDAKISLKDSAGSQTIIDDFSLYFIEMGPASNLVNYGQTELIRPGLVSSSSSYLPGGDIVALERHIESELKQAGENTMQPIDIPESSDLPSDSSQYFTSFFSSLLSGHLTSPHETFGHPVASCIIISSHNQSPIETLVSLYKSSSEHLPPYIDSGFLRYYILIHDEDEHDLEKSMALFSRMKNSFGIHCWMLRLSSKQVILEDDAVLEVPVFKRRSAPEYLRTHWSGRSTSFLPANSDLDSTAQKTHYIPYVDHAGLQTMLREMTTQSIIPYMERCISIWNDQVAAPRRGLAGRFFKAGRSLWSSSRSSTPVHNTGNYNTQTSSYPPSSPESQLRKLADFAFMLRDWKLSHGIYDMIRKDYNNDKAWRYHAGAQEMYIITLLLLPCQITTKIRIDTIDPTLDSAVYGYLSRCSSPFSALRTIIVAAELLRLRKSGKDDSTKWLMRAMDLNILGDTTRAILVDRVSFTFSSPPRPKRLRKTAFWKVLAAEHWSTIGKRRLARDALRSALAIYGSMAGWVAIDTTLKLLRSETGMVDGFLLTPAHREKELPCDPLELREDYVEEEGDPLGAVSRVSTNIL